MASGLLVLLAAGASESVDYGSKDVLGYFIQPLHVPEAFNASDGVIAAFGPEFEFGLATAPAHVEDDLADAWAAFADAGGVSGWKNAPRAAERTRFWSEPLNEIEIAANAGAKVFRMGVDWSRLFPTEGSSAEAQMDAAAWGQYARILKLCSQKGMRVMLTLFHHSMPPWLAEDGGWTNESSVGHFDTFASAVLGEIAQDQELAGLMHSLVTVNEPHVFAMLTYCLGIWPPGNISTLESLGCVTPWGGYGLSMANMAKAHRVAYAAARRVGLSSLRIGAAHHVPVYDAKTTLDRPAQRLSEILTTYHFQDLISDVTDW
jgi:beta-glucosidase/6-phospho-beta-glucosidase/beta-galactosidase